MDRDQFEFPQQLRQLAETNIEQTRAACAQMVDALTKAMDLCLNSMPQNEMTAGLKVVQAQVIKFSRQNVEAGLNLATELANATSFPDILNIQTAYAKTQLHVLSYQANQLARLMARVQWHTRLSSSM